MTSAKIGSLAAAVRRATLRLERALVIWGPAAAAELKAGNGADSVARLYVRRAAERLRSAKDAAIPEGPQMPVAIRNAVDAAHGVIVRAWPYFSSVLDIDLSVTRRPGRRPKA